MKRLMLVTLCIIGVGGCGNSQHSATTTSAATPTRNDNTGVNVRDRDSASKTPLDQKENKADLEITADIRKQVVGTDMSTAAKNVKIITESGHVTLRGPVKSADEKSRIEKFAVQVAGTGKVDNQLEIENAP